MIQHIQRPIVDSFGEVVKATEVVLLPYLKTINPEIVQIHYEHGHPLEIVDTLTEMTQVQQYQKKKYPLVGLFQDIVESKGRTKGYAGTAPLNFIIANSSEAKYKAKKRYQVNFNPILEVIYEELLRQLFKHPDFVVVSPDQIEHSKIDRLYWGKDGLYGKTGNVFNDRLDCIEVQGLPVTMKKTSICSTPTLFKNF